MFYTWCAHRLFVGCPPVGCALDAYVSPMGCPLVAHRGVRVLPVGCLWVAHGCPWVTCRAYVGHPWAAHGVFRWSVMGCESQMGCSWALCPVGMPMEIHHEDIYSFLRRGKQGIHF